MPRFTGALSRPGPAAPALGYVQLHLQSLLLTGQHTDLSLISALRHYRLYHLCVCTRSDFFHAACRFRKLSQLDPDLGSACHHLIKCGGTIDLSNDDPHAVDCLVYFLYHDEYRYSSSAPLTAQPPIPGPESDPILSSPSSVGNDPPSTSPPDALTLHARVFILADYCLLPELKILALDKFKAQSPERYHDIPNVPAFLDLVTEIYTSTTDSTTELRAAAASIFRNHLKQLLKFEEANDLLVGNGHLGRDIARLVSND